MPSVQFVPSKNEAVKFVPEGAAALDELVEMVIERATR